MSLKTITSLSHFFGKDSRYVLAGGGNTSYKDKKNLYIKPSGISLAEIKETDFVKMNRDKIRKIFDFKFECNSEEREAVVKKIMSDAVSHDSTGRPSVEAPLHEIISSTYVVHLHPAMVNGMTCSQNGKSKCAELFPDALWIDYTDPGFMLAMKVHSEIAAYKKLNSREPHIIILQNHGIFVGGNNEGAIKEIYSDIMTELDEYYKRKNVSTTLPEDTPCPETVTKTSPKLRAWLGDGASYCAVNSMGPLKLAEGPLSPDHIVYAKSFALISDNITKDEVSGFAQKNGYKPLVASVPGKAVFCTGKTLKDALTTAELAKDAALVQQLTEAFGGPLYLSEENRKFIENWEVESYRKKVAGASGGRLNGKIALITGGAQGFGYGIAEELAKEGATIAIADVNYSGAEKAANMLCSDFGKNKAFAVEVNISDEESVAAMTKKLISKCGGLDIFIANAGVLRAGSVKSLTKKDWDFVTDINYSGYFLCVKYAALLMSEQNAEGNIWTDIVQINSKSGLQGSNKNAAYAGSKFGTIGLTQSFAMELIEDKIKVNSVCPGNFFDGPLWSDQEKGLFVQYLRSGKVPGAKSIEDVKKFYESKIPMNRGCTPADVAKAIIYAVEQKYETGQAIPVTGGQVMLN
ncbi:MAG: hypothetical protein A2017_09520 [Lentisphaerae bacterium GWF2_44_16]|nr:MAG: hypothetical protein A2017_09520 [Lentisphaerae bacterium GWF2_44_16]